MLLVALAVLLPLPLVAGHIAFWHSSMFGFNVTQQTFPYDNRPVVPLVNRQFNEWWYHGHLGYPPHPEDVFDLPAGGLSNAQLACNKGATGFYQSSEGGKIFDPNNPNNPCPGSPTSEFHTTGLSDVKGCALAIAYKSDVSQVQPEDFTVFSVNQTCVWNVNTTFAVPANLPACPNDMCQCAFFWIHSPDSGSEQNYMNGFQCRVTNAISNVPVATSKVPRRCGADPANGKPNAVPGNCTYGAQQPFYWFQAEGNNMFEGTYSPPFYNDLYNFKDGSQDDIFENSYANIPEPGPNQTALPVPATHGALVTSSASTGSAATSTVPTPTGTASATLPSSPSTASDSGTNTPTLPSSSDLGSATLPYSTPSTASTGSANTPILPSSSDPGSASTPSAAPTLRCPSKGNPSPLSRRQFAGRQRTSSSSWAHRHGHSRKSNF